MKTLRLNWGEGITKKTRRSARSTKKRSYLLGLRDRRNFCCPLTDLCALFVTNNSPAEAGN
jgi:hypothetical protein